MVIESSRFEVCNSKNALLSSLGCNFVVYIASQSNYSHLGMFWS